MTHGTSEFGRYFRGQAGEVIANRAMDTSACRLLVNNLNHLQDEQTQIGANVCGLASGGISLGYYECVGATATTWTPFQSLPYPLVFLRMRSDGTSTRLIVRVRWYLASAGTGTLNIALRTFDSSGTRSISPPDPDVTDPTSVSTTTTSTTATEKSLTVYVDQADARWRYPLPSLDENGIVTSVFANLAQLEVWGQTTGGNPRIEALTVREYVG